jgi:YHS domain-containing protein
MKKRTKIILYTTSVVGLLIIVFALTNRIMPLSMGHGEVNTPLFSDEAINGYDPVAFFTENKAVEGKGEFTFKWKEAEWKFSSERNMDLFKANPEKYEPEYGGYCAFAISTGFSANCNPSSFVIIDEKLYLFDSDEIKSDWLKNRDKNIREGNRNWN